MTGPLLALALAATPVPAGVDAGSASAGAPSPQAPAPSATPETDAGAPAAVEVGGVLVPIAADPSTPGHRAVEGAVDDDVPLTRPRLGRPTNEGPYDELLDQRAADLTNCSIWSPEGAAVKGWLSLEWMVDATGAVSAFHVLENGLQSPLVERCLLREMRNWTFPAPPAGPIRVRHAFYLSIPARTDLAPNTEAFPSP